MAFTHTGEMVDLGAGRGWLSRPPAASIRRIDRQIGHPLQITEAGRTWRRQNEHWLTYKRVGWPIALHPDTPSEHQKGLSIDSDEAQRIIAILEDHGWRRTVYRWVNGVWTLVERWHFEYFLHLDNHRNDPEPTAPPVPEEDEDMKIIRWAANGACWLMGDESTDYIATGPELAALEGVFGPARTVENAALTAVVASLKVPWAAMESTFRSQAFDNESRFGKGTSWTRTMAEAQRETLADEGLAKSIDELQRAIGDAKTAS